VEDAVVTLRWARDREDVLGAFAVRQRVFCEEQGVPSEEELDGRDEDALHLVGLDPREQHRVIATLRVLIDGEKAKISRVAVEREWRRRGIALRMLALALDAARERGCRDVRLAAQIAAKTLYERAGFTVQSEPFEEAGMVHVWMGMALPAQE
jgi:predicted GNAT family N-acyltransferase